MMMWLQDDLSLTNANWIIAYWHHPPYSKGSHNSDTESQLIDMRQNAVPILEGFGVDLVLSGHSHTYERSYLIDGHYGTSNTLEAFMILDSGDGNVNGDGAYVKPTLGPSSHEGSVYVVAGSSGKTSSLQPDAPHAVMFATLPELGSLVVDINGNNLEGRFLDSNGNFLDDFTIVKGSTGPTCGNGIRESGEGCDGLDFGGVTCSDFGCDAGSLSCTLFKPVV